MRALRLASSSLILAWSLAGLVACSSAAGGIMDGPPAEPPAEEPPAEEPPAEEPPLEEDAGASTTADTGARKDSGSGTRPDSGSSTPPDASLPVDTGSPSSPDTGSVSGLPLVANLGISEIAWFQGVKVPVAKGGVRVTTRGADVIAGREALVRVYVAPRSGWVATEVVGQLQLVSASGTRTYSASLIPTAASSDAVLGSTLNFDVPTDVLSVDTRYSVALFAKSGGGSGDTSGARYPAGGTARRSTRCSRPSASR
ncbi:MAG: hypothetical protein HYV09_22875 [Deltaproteobacteria bacterium]|nr:hypothetical protein [Deltaproteobacteria bacterium]